MLPALERHLGRLRCPRCGAELDEVDEAVACRECGRRYPIVRGTLRMLPETPARAGDVDAQARTAASFAYEWSRFGAPRPEWAKNFLDYMQPHDAAWFAGRSMLDVGTGSGRHAREAARLGAEVVAVDVGDSIDVARENVPDEVLTVQADAHSLPFAPGSFDFIVSIGVLHHLPDTEEVVGKLATFARPGGNVRVYLYWQPPQRWHRAVLGGVTAARRVTTRLPHPLLHALCYPLAALLYASVVLPHKLARRVAALRPLSRRLPLKTYADYPFGVLVNDQFDRFSAPIERRFKSDEVRAMLDAAGLEGITVIPHHGWIGEGRVPATRL